MPTKDIPPGTSFDPGDTAPTVRAKLNANLAWAEAAAQGVEDRLESTVAAALGDGVVSGLGVSPATGLTIAVDAGTALVGFAVECAGGTLAVPPGGVSAVRLTQSGDLDIRPLAEDPPVERCILLATVEAGDDAVSSTDNNPDGRGAVQLLAAWDTTDPAPIAERLIAFDPAWGHRHDGTDGRALSGTPLGSFSIGDGTDRTITLYARNADPSSPGIRYSHTGDRWEYSNDGSAWNELGIGGGAGAPSDSVTPATSYGAVSTAGTSASYARGDHSHGTPALGIGTPTVVAPGAEGSAGSGSLPARQDHAHAVATASPTGAFASTAAEGVSACLARADHVHAAYDTLVPANVAPVATTGLSANAARRDHTHQGVHSLARSGDSQMVGDVVLAAGSNVALTQSGQTITISSAGGSGTLGDSVTAEAAFGASAQAGASLSASRSDHTHGTPATPVTSLAAEGSDPLTGSVTLSAGSLVALTQAGSEIEISAEPTLPGGSVSEVQFHDGGSFGGSPYLTLDKASGLLSTREVRGHGAIEAQGDGSVGRLRGCHAHASAIASGTVLAAFEGAGRLGSALGTGAGMYVTTSQDWSVGSAQGSGLRFSVVANNGVSQLTALEITQGRAVHAYGSLVSFGNTTLGNASTNTIVCTGRLRPRVLASHPLHAAPGSRPAGDVGELARYGGDFYLCRNASTPEWARIGGTRSVSFAVTGSDTEVTIGDGKHAFCVPADMAGMELVSATARVVTAGATGTTEIQLRRSRDTAGSPRTSSDADMLSTKLSIDSGELSTTTAATPAVIATTADDLLEGDLILVDVDAVSDTKPRGLSVALVFALPSI